MTIEEKVHSLLVAASGVTSYVPSDRIKNRGDWQNISRPWIMHQMIACDPQYVSGGQIPITEWQYQVSVFTDASNSTGTVGYSIARAIVNAVIAAIDGTHDDLTMFCSGVTAAESGDVRQEHLAILFSAWFNFP